MSLANEIYQEIRVLTQHLTAASICRDNQFPVSASGPGGIVEVYPAKSMNLSGAMRDVPYHEAYLAARNGLAYNMILLDGAMISLRYKIRPAKKEIVKHTLNFWPSPRLMASDQATWIYDEDEPFGDAVDFGGVLPVPVRFDYAPEQFVELSHSKCHATFGQYPNCRIPVAGPVRPGLFLDFILRNFYSRELGSLGKNFPFEFFECSKCITQKEAEGALHFMVPRAL